MALYQKLQRKPAEADSATRQKVPISSFTTQVMTNLYIYMVYLADVAISEDPVDIRGVTSPRLSKLSV